MKSKKKKIFSNKKFSNTKDRNKLFYDKILEYDIVDKKKYNIAYTFMKNSKFDFKLTSNLYNKIKRIKINKFKPYKIEKKKIKEEDYNYLFEKIPNLIYNSIITNLKNRIIFSKGNRLINIYYDKNIDFQMIRKIDIILNMFDSILQNEKYYSIDLFLSPLKKKIYKNKSIEKVNINTGSIKYKRNYITIYREEEWDKVLIHELIHYKHLHILSIRDKLKYAFKDINFKGSILNPNEAYVESMAIILYCLYNYHLKQKYIKVPLKKYIEIRISIEMGWSLGQFIKILHHKKKLSLNTTSSSQSIHRIPRTQLLRSNSVERNPAMIILNRRSKRKTYVHVDSVQPNEQNEKTGTVAPNPSTGAVTFHGTKRNLPVRQHYSSENVESLQDKLQQLEKLYRQWWIPPCYLLISTLEEM